MSPASARIPLDAVSPAAEEAPVEDRAWVRLRRSPSAWIGGVIVAAVIALATAAPWIAPHPLDYRGGQHRPPTGEHPLGTDSFERDVLTRTLYGARLSLVAGGLSVALAVVIGVSIGAIAGLAGGWTDALLMRTIDVLLSFPSILVALLAMIALSPGWYAVIAAVAMINVPVFARQVRATVLGVRELDYVAAAYALGASHWYVLSRVIAPSLVSPVLVLATLGLGAAILEVAGLAFLGIAGSDPTTPEWGSMLADAKDHLTASYWPAFAPGAAISLTILGFNLLGDGLRDALDPKLS